MSLKRGMLNWQMSNLISLESKKKVSIETSMKLKVDQQSSTITVFGLEVLDRPICLSCVHQSKS
jgi:hypothetical protein